MNIQDKIKEKLSQIEKEEDIQILYAVESGSRAWGFSSHNSDYDVRMIYVRKIDWYLSVNLKRDVLEYPINEELDIVGWDLLKALRLFAKSNPPLLEWLQSPIIYAEKGEFASRLRELTTSYLSKRSCLYHYLHMATGNYRDYLQQDTVRLKKYLYVLRPLLACEWLEKKSEPIPIEMDTLLKQTVLTKNIRKQIEILIERKKAGDELSEGARIDVLNDFIEERIAYYKSYTDSLEEGQEIDFGILNEFFTKTLQQYWGYSLTQK